MLAIIIVIAVIVVIVGLVVLSYNGLVRLRNGVDNNAAQIDVQLTRRHDLIPNLVQTVKGYAAHESSTLEAVVAARNQATAATGMADKAQAENALSGTLKSLFAVAEAYPDLKANQNFQQLQAELGATENGIASSRQLYNDSVRTYNTRTETFPAVVIARSFGFTKREFFAADEGSRANVVVNFES